MNILVGLARRGFLKFLSDKSYISLVYKTRMKKKLNIDNPQTFNEKIQYLKTALTLKITSKEESMCKPLKTET